MSRILLVLGFMVLGCGRVGLDGAIPVRGKVTYLGKPVAAGEVRYIPTDTQGGRIARGRLNAQGEFQLTSLKRGDGALPGGYRIVILAEAPESDQNEDAVASPGDAALASKMRYKQPVKKVHRGSQGPASQVPLRYTRPQDSGLTDHVDSQHSGYKEFNLTDE